MTAHHERNRRLLAPLGLAALAALTVVGCSTPDEKPAATATVTVTTTSTPALQTPQTTSVATPPTSIVAAPPSTVTVTPQAPPPPVVNDVAGTFQSPSGNIVCNMYAATGGVATAICNVTEHDWLAPAPENCGANSGDRIDLEAGSPARIGCYGQGMPPATRTLQYGQSQKFGTITCTSESNGVKCVDAASGHYFSVSRDQYLIG